MDFFGEKNMIDLDGKERFTLLDEIYESVEQDCVCALGRSLSRQISRFAFNKMNQSNKKRNFTNLHLKLKGLLTLTKCTE